MADYRLNPRTFAELFLGLPLFVVALLRRTGCRDRDIGAAYRLLHAISAVSQDLLRRVAGQATDLLPMGGQRVTVIGIPPEGQCTHNQAADRFPNRTLIPELVLLVIFTLRDALNLRLMKAVYLILV